MNSQKNIALLHILKIICKGRGVEIARFLDVPFSLTALTEETLFFSSFPSRLSAVLILVSIRDRVCSLVTSDVDSPSGEWMANKLGWHSDTVPASSSNDDMNQSQWGKRMPPIHHIKMTIKHPWVSRSRMFSPTSGRNERSLVPEHLFECSAQRTL